LFPPLDEPATAIVRLAIRAILDTINDFFIGDY